MKPLQQSLYSKGYELTLLCCRWELSTWIVDVSEGTSQARALHLHRLLFEVPSAAASTTTFWVLAVKVGIPLLSRSPLLHRSTWQSTWANQRYYGWSPYFKPGSLLGVHRIATLLRITVKIMFSAWVEKKIWRLAAVSFSGVKSAVHAFISCKWQPHSPAPTTWERCLGRNNCCWNSWSHLKQSFR